MMLNQEELNQIFPKDEVPLGLRRYCVGWYHRDTREFIIVYDKLSHKLVFKSNSNIVVDETGKSISRQRQYCHIKKFYGERDCEPPRQINPSFYDGL